MTSRKGIKNKQFMERKERSAQPGKDFYKDFYYNWTGLESEFHQVQHWINEWFEKNTGASLNTSGGIRWVNLSDKEYPKQEQEVFWDGGENPPAYGRFRTIGKFSYVVLLDSSGEENLDSIDEYERWLDESGQSGEGDATKIICLCGSVRFAAEFHKWEFDLSVKGIMVLAPCAYNNDVQVTNPDAKKAFDLLHKRKIDLSDEVFVLNVGGYIGESTRNEINYANEINKPVKYLEPTI